MNKDLQARAAKCEGLELIVYGRAPEGFGDLGLANPKTNYDDWNNVMRLRDLAIAKNRKEYVFQLWINNPRGTMHEGEALKFWRGEWTYGTIIKVNKVLIREAVCATKEQILEAAVRTLEEAT